MVEVGRGGEGSSLLEFVNETMRLYICTYKTMSFISS